MYNKDSSPTVIGCRFMRNAAPGSLAGGGGMYNDNSNPIIVNCLFDANVSTAGGGMFNFFSSPIITNCSFAANNSGILNSFSSPTISNCVFWANDSFQIGDGSLSSSTVSYSDVQGGWSGAGSNNIDADPLFVSISNCCTPRFTPGCDDPGCELAVCEVDPFCCDTVWDLYCAALAFDMCSVCPNDSRLQPGSPCIDAGNNTAVPQEITTDLDGNPRFVDDPDTPDTGNPPGGGPIVDMGAYEFQVVSVCPWDLDGDGNVFVTDLLLLLMDFGSCDGSPADFDGDGCVTVVDLLTLLANWGPCPGSGCVWDVNGDGTVDQTDLWQVLGSLGPCDTPAACPEDVNGDGVVDGQDVAAVATHFGPCP